MRKSVLFTEKAEMIADFLIENHTEEAEAVNAVDLCMLFHLHKQDLRRLINYLRTTGLPICSSNSGYWYSENEVDVKNTLVALKSRIEGMNRAIQGLEEFLESKGV